MNTTMNNLNDIFDDEPMNFNRVSHLDTSNAFAFNKEYTLG